MTKNERLSEIARERLAIDTLTLDDPEAGAVRQALEAAYALGQGELLAAAEALLAAKDARMETVGEWRRLRRAVRQAKKN